MKLNEINTFSQEPVDDDLMHSRWREPLSDMKYIALLPNGYEIWSSQWPIRSHAQIYFVFGQNKDIVGSVQVRKRELTNISNVLTVAIINILSTHRRMGLAKHFYGFLLKNGYKIASDLDQSQYGKALWLSLAKTHTARLYNRRTGELQKPTKDITDAYDNSTFIVVLSQ